MIFLILPNQLFDIKHFDKSFKYILWECPHFFTDYNYNKKKLLLHRATMKYQYDLMKKNGYNITYNEFNTKLPNAEQYMLYYPINKLDILKLPTNTIVYDKETPNLLLTREHITRYHNKTDKFFFNAFYMWSKKELNIIPNIKSQDKLNRQKPKNIVCISQPYEDIVVKKDILKYIDDAKKYVEKHFKNNCGILDKANNFIYPITRSDSLKWLEHFILKKIKNYGNYQDFIDKNNNHLCHSLLSALINIGLINPSDIIIILEKERKTLDIPMNSYEGFIRQLFWREYQHLCYIYVDFSKNYFGNNKLLTKEWYTGNTGIIPVDDSIREAFETGYLHHIKRLMVIGNYMNLCNIKPSEGFRWFMEFSCDSYEWVMYQNVYDMVFFTTGGKTMRRPYISSSNYILNMSNYSKDNWCEIWNTKYRAFIAKNKKKLWKYRYYVALK
jgi:deoxyribodipyrimidine photolyase-related protein